MSRDDVKKYGHGITVVKTKDGNEYAGPIQKWRPEDNYLILDTFPKETKISFDDMVSAECMDRISINSPIDGEYQDQIERARRDLKRGRKYNWFKKEVPIYGWEKK